MPKWDLLRFVCLLISLVSNFSNQPFILSSARSAACHPLRLTESCDILDVLNNHIWCLHTYHSVIVWNVCKEKLVFLLLFNGLLMSILNQHGMLIHLKNLNLHASQIILSIALWTMGWQRAIIEKMYNFTMFLAWSFVFLAESSVNPFFAFLQKPRSICILYEWRLFGQKASCVCFWPHFVLCLTFSVDSQLSFCRIKLR